MWLLLPLLLLFSFVVAAADTRACYFPDGTKALDHVPCSDQSNTACCGSDHICMANGLCLNSGSHQPFGFSRAACTDSNWGVDCPHVCVSSSDHRNGGCGIIPLAPNGMDTTYCCDAVVSNGTNAVCAHSEDPFKLGHGEVIPGRAYLSNCTASDHNRENDVIIGAGVGIPLGLFFLMALAWALVERKKRYALLNSPAVARAFPISQLGPGGQVLMHQGMTAPPPPQELESIKYPKPQELEGYR